MGSFTLDGLAGRFIVIDYVVTAVVLAYLVSHRFLCVRNRYAAERGIACSPGSIEKQFEIHHVVDDDRKVVGLVAMP